MIQIGSSPTHTRAHKTSSVVDNYMYQHSCLLTQKRRMESRYLTIAQLQSRLDGGGPALSTYRDAGSNGRTLLHWASFDNNPTKVAWLIDHGGLDVNATADNGDTPAVDAVRMGAIEALKELMRRGSQPPLRQLILEGQGELAFFADANERFQNDRLNQENLQRAVAMSAFLHGLLFASDALIGTLELLN